jgi:Flp pilus assembly protein TadB
MKHTPPTPTTATPRDDARTPQPSRPTLGEMLEEVIDLTAGIGVMLLPLLLLAVPGIILFVVLPAILLVALAAPLAVVGAVIAGPPYLLVRWLRRRRRRAGSPSADRGLRPAGRAVSRSI